MIHRLCCRKQLAFQSFSTIVLVELTAKEIGLMACFMCNPKQIYSKETLFERAWVEDIYGANNTMIVHIRWLRKNSEDGK